MKQLETPTLLGRIGLAERYGVKPGAIDKWRERYDDFPAHVSMSSGKRGRLWNVLETDEWVAQKWPQA